MTDFRTVYSANYAMFYAVRAAVFVVIFVILIDPHSVRAESKKFNIVCSLPRMSGRYKTGYMPPPHDDGRSHWNLAINLVAGTYQFSGGDYIPEYLPKPKPFARMTSRVLFIVDYKDMTRKYDLKTHIFSDVERRHDGIWVIYRGVCLVRPFSLPTSAKH
jgi:hypothetical protein